MQFCTGLWSLSIQTEWQGLVRVSTGLQLSQQSSLQSCIDYFLNGRTISPNIKCFCTRLHALPLTSREQYVVFSGHSSTNSRITHGVPQGPILGSLYFDLHKWFSYVLQTFPTSANYELSCISIWLWSSATPTNLVLNSEQKYLPMEQKFWS